MKLKIKSILTFLVLYLLSFNLYAVNLDTVGNGYSYINYTTKDGLPSNEVYCVFEDSKGYIWIGTDRGVAKFDGHSFEVFTTEDGLSTNVVFGIAEDSYGRIWFTGDKPRLAFFLNNTFHDFKQNKELKHVLDSIGNNNSIYFEEIYIDSLDCIFLNSVNKGFVKIDLNTPSIVSNFYDKKSYASNFVRFSDNNYSHFAQFYLVDYKNKLVNISLNDNRTYKFSSNEVLRGKRAYFYDIDSLQYLYYGNNYFKINKDSIEHLVLKHNIRLFPLRKMFIINEFGNHSTGNVFISKTAALISDKVLLLDKKMRVTPSVLDRNGAIWLGSLHSGVFFIPNLAIKVINKRINNIGIIPSKNHLIFLDRDNLHIKWNLKDRNSINYEHIIISDLLDVKTDVINLLNPIEIKSLNAWIYNHSGTGSGTAVKNILQFGDKILFNVIGKFIESKNGNFQLKADLSKTKTYSFCLIEDDTLISNNKGIFLVEDTLVPFQLDNKIFSKRAQDIKYLKSKDILLIATIGNGLFIYKNKKLIQHFTNKNGLMSNTINQLFRENDNRVWIATNKGVNYLDISDSVTFEMNSLFSSSKSLLSPNIQQLYLYNDSLLYLGTDKGVNEINLNILFKQRHSIIPIILDKIKINDSEISIDSIIGIDLDFNQNNIIFSYNALAFSKFGDLSFRYKLKGLTENWVYTRNRKASFLQLSPGEYEFQIETQNEFGDWLGYDKAIVFIINKPYWKTAWFIGGILLLVLLTLGGILYYYISNLKTEKKLLEQQQFLSNQLNESRQKALNSQLNPHFVFNSLNSIQNYILTKKTELSSDYLSMFSKLMRYVFENSKKLFVPLSDEIQALDLYISLEKVRHDNSFDYEIRFDENIISKIYMPSLLIQPIIENAIWHGLLTKKGSNKMLIVSFKHVMSELHIVVEDNGVGRKFSKNKPKVKLIKKQKSSGVDLTKERIALLKDSTGLNTSFEVEDLYNNQQEGIGTRITIVIPDNLYMAN